MKARINLWMLGIAAMLASCSSEDVLQGTNDSRMKSVTVAVNLEGVNPYTRALTPTMTETDAEVTRCYMEVLEDGTSKELVTMTGNKTDGYTSTLSLNPEKEYKFLFWADGGEGCYTIDADGQRLQDIKVKDGAAVSIAYQAVKNWDKSETVSAELTHAVAKVSLKTTTDLESGKAVSLTIPSYSGYKVGGNTDDANDIFAGTTRTSHEYTATLSADITGDATDGAFVFSCYVLNNQNEEATLQYSDNPATPVYNVPLKANQHSTLLGDLANLGLTSTSVTATINPDWDDADPTEYPNEATAYVTNHTIRTFAKGQIAENQTLISTAIGDDGTTIAVDGPMDANDVETIKNYLKAQSAITGLTLDFSAVKDLTTFPGTNVSDSAHPSEWPGVTSVILPEGLTTLEMGSFQYCTELTSVTLPSTLETIGASAFSGCTSLTEVILPSSLKTIEYSAFWGCSGLTKIDLSNTQVESIRNSTFEECTSLEEVVLGNSIKSIGDGTFGFCI